MKEKLLHILKNYDLHDMDIVVIHNGEIIYEDFLSNETIEVKPMKRTDLYRIASISKLFVGVAIMQLFEQNLLNLEDNIEDYIPFKLRNQNFPNIPITVKHLLTHTSGLQDTSTYHVPYNEHSKELFTQGGKYYSDSMYSNNEPGKAFIYYNAGFHLLALAIETITNIRFDVYIEKMILTPLNMKGSFNVYDKYTLNHIRPLYRKIRGEWTIQCDGNLTPRNFNEYVISTNGSLFSPQGGMRSNAKELSKFMLDLMSESPKVLRRETLEFMLEIQYKDNHTKIDDYNDFYMNCGIVFHIVNDQSINKPMKDLEGTLVGHYGLAYGLHGNFYFNPDTKNGLIFNTTGEGMEFQKYQSSQSQFLKFQEDIFEYIKREFWLE